MSTTINDGGPAFPHDGQANYTGGMTLRDWFAGQSLAGLLHHPVYKDTSDDTMAKYAYQQADAMIKAREVRP